MVNRSIVGLLFLGLIVAGIVTAVGAFIEAEQALRYKFIDKVTPESVETLSNFLDLNEDKDIKIFIESPGGLVLGLHKLVYYIDKHKGKISCVVDLYAASAAAILALECDELEVAPRAWLMFHMPRVCDFAGCTVVSPNFLPEVYTEWAAYYIEHQDKFTDEQLEALLEGEDVWIEGRDFK